MTPRQIEYKAVLKKLKTKAENHKRSGFFPLPHYCNYWWNIKKSLCWTENGTKTGLSLKDFIYSKTNKNMIAERHK